MNKLFVYFFVTLMLFALVTVSSGETYDLKQIIGSRDFWSSYTWGNFEENDIYKSVTWALRGGSTGTDNYITSLWLSDLNSDAVRMTVNRNSKEVSSFEIISYNKENLDDYRRFVNWCTEKFGDSRTETKRDEASGEYAIYVLTSSWSVGNTIIRVRTEKNVSNGPKSVGFITSLSFAKNFILPVPIVNEVQPQKLDHGKGTGVARRNDLPGKEQAAQATTGPVNPVPLRADLSHAYREASTPDPVPVKPVTGKQYQQPPYIWEDELGTTHATNDITSVPENRRAVFEINRQD
jgi:hypothetical protein